MIGAEHFVLELIKKPAGRVVVSALMIAAGMFFWFLSYPQLSDARALNAHGRRTVAKVIDSRISSNSHGFGKNYVGSLPLSGRARRRVVHDDGKGAARSH
jgi:hypothetical protein